METHNLEPFFDFVYLVQEEQEWNIPEIPGIQRYLALDGSSLLDFSRSLYPKEEDAHQVVEDYLQSDHFWKETMDENYITASHLMPGQLYRYMVTSIEQGMEWVKEIQKFIRENKKALVENFVDGGYDLFNVLFDLARQLKVLGEYLEIENEIVFLLHTYYGEEADNHIKLLLKEYEISL